MTAEPIEDAATRPTLATDPSSTAPAVVKQRRRVWLACALHLIAAWVAALLAWMEVESIMVTLPVVAIFGLVVTLIAMRRSSWLLLCFGLSGFWSVAVVSLLISCLSLSPGRAVPGVPILLAFYALLLTVMFSVVLRSSKNHLAGYFVKVPRLQFRVRTLILLATAVCVLSALGKLATWHGEMSVFALVGFALSGLSALFAFALAVRERKAEVQQVPPPDQLESP